MIYTAQANKMTDEEGYQITPVCMGSALGNSPKVAAEKLLRIVEDQDPFAKDVVKWIEKNNDTLVGWIEKDDDRAYYCGEGKFRYDVQGDRFDA